MWANDDVDMTIIETAQQIGQVGDGQYRDIENVKELGANLITIVELQEKLNTLNSNNLTTLLLNAFELHDSKLDISGKRALCGYVALSKNFDTLSKDQKSQIFNTIKGVGNLDCGLAKVLIDSSTDPRFVGLDKFITDLRLKERVAESLAAPLMSQSYDDINLQETPKISVAAPTSPDPNPQQPSLLSILRKCFSFCGGKN